MAPVVVRRKKAPVVVNKQDVPKKSQKAGDCYHEKGLDPEPPKYQSAVRQVRRALPGGNAGSYGTVGCYLTVRRLV